MTAEKLLERTARDSMQRLRWRVMERLGVCPLSLRGRLLSCRRAAAIACQMILDVQQPDGADAYGANPNFDMQRFRRLAGGTEV